jgi:uncharacterized membrane protein YozB (DUF420 family)
VSGWGGSASTAVAVPLAAQVVAIGEVALAVVLIVGMLAVRGGRVRLHRYLQASVVFVNIPIVAIWMLPRFSSDVLPDLPGEISGLYYLLPTLALFLGAAAEALGVYIVLVAATTLIPERFRFRRYKLWMRTELVLWWAVVAVGLGIYASWYLTPATGGW